MFQKIKERMSWVHGRSCGVYFKKELMVAKKMDVHLIMYPPGGYLERHIDPAPEGYVSHRVNIVLRAPTRGGQFIGLSTLRLFGGRFIYFKSSETYHGVAKVDGVKSRIVLSIGWLRKKK